MDAFRNLLRGWVGKALLALIILPFAIVGIEGVFTGGGRNKPAIEINGHEISKAEFDQAVENRRQQLLERMGEGVDPGMITAEMVKPATEKALIQRQLIIEAAESEGLYVPPETVKSYVRSLPQFHDEKGVFSQEKLERFLAQAGFSSARIFNEVSADMVTEQLQGGISESAFAIPQDVTRILELDKQTRDIDVVVIKPESFKASINLSDDDIKAFYEKNAGDFRSDEKVQVEYLHFTQADFVDANAVISDEQINARLAEKAEKAKQNERRRAAHVLIEVGDKRSDEEAKALAEAVLKDAKDGKAFDVLAKEKSDDFATAKSGGDLGFAAKGVYDPAFEDALYSLKSVDELSGVVKTEFGYHVIKLLGIESPEVPAADANRDAIVAELRQEQAKEKMTLAVDELNRIGFESGDLSVISEQYKKKVEVSDWLTRRGGNGVFANAKVKDAAFSDATIQEQRNSDVIEMDDGSLIILRLKAHEAPRQLSLEEVKDKVTQRLLVEKARDKAKTTADEILAKLKAGEDRNAVVTAANLSWEANPAVERTAAKPARQVVQKAFELPKPEQGKYSNAQVEGPNGDIMLISVSNVATKVLDRTDAEKQQFSKGLAYRNGMMEMEGFVTSLQSKAEIVKYESDETK